MSCRSPNKLYAENRNDELEVSTMNKRNWNFGQNMNYGAFRHRFGLWNAVFSPLNPNSCEWGEVLDSVGNRHNMAIGDNKWRVWSQNEINAREKNDLPREKVDGRQANANPLPFICKMRYIPPLLPLRLGLSLQNAICDMHGALLLGNSIFFTVALSRFVTKPFKYTLTGTWHVHINHQKPRQCTHLFNLNN